jgi:MoaA/NifB/PqqE/SkfB family radical SAM enzyme
LVVASFHERVPLFERDRLEHRFWSPAWSSERVRVETSEVTARIDALDPERTQRVTIAGGRPTDHQDLFDVIARVKARGISRIGLESDARSLADAAVVTALVEAGVRDLFLYVGGIRKRVHEQVMSDPGGREDALRGIVNAAGSGATTYLVVPLMRWTVDDILPLLEWTEAASARPRGLLLSLPPIDELPAVARKHTLPYAEAAEHAARIFRRCHDTRLEYGFDAPRGITPCASRALDRFGTVFHERMAHYKRAPHLELRTVPVCESCSLRNACRGIEPAYLETFGHEGLEPVPLDVSMEWKLRPLNKLEQRDFKNISDFRNVVEENARSLIRINGHCNMSCAFCFVDRTAPDFPADGLEHEIDRMWTWNKNHLVLSGGEPTLHPELPRLLSRGRTLGFRTVEIQTNGVRLAELAYAEQLVDAGLNKATISLHSVDPEHSDRITRLPRAFGRTIAGMHNLRRLGIETQIAHVLTKANYAELPTFVRYLGQEFPTSEGHLSICLAIAQGISDLVYDWVIPSFTEIKPFVRNALDYCLENDIGFGGMLGQGGYPPCMLDGEMKYYERVLGHIYRSGDHNAQFHKAERCRECSFDAHCVGVRKSYVECYGEAEIKPFRAEIPNVAAQQAPPSELIVLRRKDASTPTR